MITGLEFDRSSPAVILVGADAAMLDRALLLNLKVFLLQPPDKVLDVQHPAILGAMVVDYRALARSDIVALARAIAAIHDVKCALSMTEFGSLPAAWINESLGLPGVSVRAVELTRHKLAMRQATAGVDPHPNARVCCDDDVIAFGRSAGWPVIVKPSDGVASMRVERVDGADRMPDIDWSQGEYIAEQYLAGRLISIESFSQAGRHTVYAINEEFPIGSAGPANCNPYVETAHELPAEVTDAQARHIGELTCAVLSALDIREGPSHTEILLTESGPRLLECHTRPGGDYIPEMYQRCTGIDLLELAIAVPLGLRALPAPPTRYERGAALRFFTPPTGRLTSLAGVQACADMPGVTMLDVRAKPGAEIRDLRSSADRVGCVMAVAGDAPRASSICREVVSRVRFDVASGAAR